LNRYTDETYKTGYLRAFFNTVKSGTDLSFERCFITGVSPVTMNDLTSGFNIGTNYSLSPEFNEMMGFTEDEVLRKDKEFSHDASIIQTLVSQGYIAGELKKGLPAVTSSLYAN